MGNGKTWSKTEKAWATADLYARGVQLGVLGLTEEDEILARAMLMQAFIAGFCDGITSHTELAQPGVSGPN